MITNLLATVTVCLVTNVTDKFPQHLEPDLQMVQPGNPAITDCVYRGHFANDANPTEKEVVTEIKSVETVEFDYNGKHFRSVSETPVSSKSEHYTLNKTWIKTQ